MRLPFPHGLFILPYVPIGLSIMILRACIYPHALLVSFLLTFSAVKRFVLRVMCFVMGLVVHVNTEKKVDKEQKSLPIIANHISLFDHLVLCLLQDIVTPHYHVFHWYASFAELHYDSVGRAIQKHNRPFQLFPEKTPSDSPDHLLIFDSTVFDSFDMVQPVAIQASRPFPVKLVEYPIVWYFEWLWHLFVPFTYYHITYLEPMQRLPDEDSVKFASRVRTAISTALQAKLCDLTADQLISKRSSDSSLDESRSSASASSTIRSGSTISPRSSVSTPRSSSSSEQIACELLQLRFRGLKSTTSTVPPSSQEPDIDECAMFDHLIPVVQRILTEATVFQIKKALADSNGDVDAAIEDLITRTGSTEQSVGSHSINHTLTPASRLSLAAEQFYGNPTARQQSLQERRNHLLIYARDRFLSVQSETDNIDAVPTA